MHVRVVRSFEIGAWLPVIDQEFSVRVIEEAVLVRPGRDCPLIPDLVRLNCNDLESERRIEKEPIGTPVWSPQGSGVGKFQGMKLAD